MELVRGLSVVEYADQKRLTIDERLTLFLDICRAVAYAHQRGVCVRSRIAGIPAWGSLNLAFVDRCVVKRRDAMSLQRYAGDTVIFEWQRDY